MAALVASPIATSFPSSSANPGGTGLVIKEVYGGGGNSGATLRQDFIELYNPTAAPISLAGFGLEYRSAGGGSAGVFALSGSVPAGGHWLVQGGAGAGGTTDIPTPDQVSTLNLSGTGGQVLLLPNTTPFAGTGNVAGNAAVIDMVGWGGSTTTFEGAAAPATTNPTSVSRNDTGADTDSNSADFLAGQPSPTASGSDPEPPGEFEGTIAEIQGAGATSPHVGKTGTTSGVVTATYPTGGYNGFYIQTAGTGGATDATPGASDAMFVFGPSFDENTLALGDLVEVTGPISEFQGTTEITVAADGVTELADAHDPVTPRAAAYPTTEADREAHEGEVLAPTDQFVVTNSFTTNRFAEVGLATGTKPLIQWTDVERPGTPEAQAVKDDNAKRAVTLDDGASIDFLPSGGGANQNIPLPYLKPDNAIRVGAAVTLTEPVVLEFRNNTWKFQPRHQVTAADAGPATFEDTRAGNASPQPVPGDLHLATFNVLNYFNTTGEAFVAAGGNCTYFNDRAGDPVANNQCTPDGPRGAAQTEDFERQQAKIVTAINKLGADIVALEEIENSVKLLGETNRDDALSALVTALNTAAGSAVWDYAISPAAADLPPVADQDVIRNAFIFKPASVALVGPSKVLTGSAPFANAREPLAQAFKPAGAEDTEAFAVITNHFKSKGSPGTGDNADTGDGQGGWNGDRTRQAAALIEFANAFATERGTDKIFLAGDFNSYSKEDPMQVLYDAGYAKVESDTAGEASYSFSGLSGSLDHVLANPDALATVEGADIWEINANESVAFQYSRHNYNATQFFDGGSPFAASDHNPELVGINTGPIVETVQILGTNDFHGRIANNPAGAEAGAATMAGAVKQLRETYADTVFAAAGDLIGASTFESFIAHDKPTIDALNEAGLEVSAVGNHEFDQGYNDLVNRVMKPYDAQTNPYGGAEWQYIGANVRLKSDGSPAVPESWIKDFGDVEVGFVGAVTEHLDELVSPAGITDIEVTDIVTEANATADELRAAGADVVVLLVHEGAATTAIGSATDPASDFGKIVNGVDKDIDAIVSGHTHLAYNHAITVPEWEAEGRPVTKRPVVSAGQYGTNLNQLLFSVDDTGEVVGLEQNILALKTGQVANYPTDPATKVIVDKAVADAEVLGAAPLGEIEGPFNRAKLANGTTENRGGESTLGNLVAEAQRWATESETSGSAQIAFMNPGGLRADMIGNNAAGYPAVLSYKQAATVQPFANTLVNTRLTGAQLKTALEQQWQPAGAARPFLRLGISEGFTYTYDPTAATGERIKRMWLDGAPIDPATSYSVTVNSFLASGGDNFGVFAQGTGARDTGKVDLQGMVDYMAEFGDPDPLAVDYSQRSVGADFPDDAPAAYQPGDQVSFNLSSLSFSTAPDRKDTEVQVKLGDTVLGTFPVDSTVGTEIFDEVGKAAVSFTLPAGTPAGEAQLTVVGATTGTEAVVSIVVEAGEPVDTTLTATAPTITYGAGGTLTVTVDPAAASGTVEVREGDEVVGSGTLDGGTAAVALGGTVLDPGSHALTVRYAGDAGHNPSSTSLTVRVVKATPTITATVSPSTIKVKKGTATVAVTVAATGFTPTGVVAAYVDGTLVDAVNLDDGEGQLVIGPFNKVGDRTVLIRYFGDDFAMAGQVTEAFKVVKRTPKLTLTHSPSKVVVNKTKATLKVSVAASGFTPTGKVTVKVNGEVVKTATLSGGKATVKLPRFAQTGDKLVTVTYTGDGLTDSDTATHTVRVTR